MLNCLISLLNSKVIDVDKLDYLIRDAFITGFDTISIDYLRLLQPLTIVEKGEFLELAYKKNAISVIENVKLFSRETLSPEGAVFKNGQKICLLCDDDIIFLMKNVFPSPNILNERIECVRFGNQRLNIMRCFLE